MLRSALCLNAVILSLTALFLCINSFSKKSRVHWTIVAVLLLVIVLVNFILTNRCVDLGWGFLLLYLDFAVTEVLLIITIIKSVLSIKTKTESPSIYTVIAMIMIPVLLFIIPYAYELYRLNTCDYLIQYNYQNGIVISEDTYLAVTNHKPAKVTLINNLFDRKIVRKYRGISNRIYCSIDFSETGEREINIYDDWSREYEAVFDKLGAVIHEENPNIKYIEIHYIPEENDAIVRLFDMGDYIYHDNIRTARISASGGVDEIIVY